MIKVEYEDNYLTAVIEGEDFQLWYDALVSTEKSGIIIDSLRNMIVDVYHRTFNQEYPKADDFSIFNCMHYKERHW